MQSFYTLSEQDRIALTEKAMAEKRSLHERWEALAIPETTDWNRRAALAAKWLATSDSVLDLGCGTMSLEKYLAAGTRYYPSDIVARDERTIVADYNFVPPPYVDAQAVVCLGVLEYLYDPLGFLTALSAMYQLCVVSYCMTDTPKPLEPRRGHAWVNDFDRAHIEKLFKLSSWHIENFQIIEDFQGLWLLKQANQASHKEL